MNSEEIKKLPKIGFDNPDVLLGKSHETIRECLNMEANLWLKEIAYQLAVMNEQQEDLAAVQKRLRSMMKEPADGTQES